MATTQVIDAVFDRPNEISGIIALETVRRSPLWSSGLVATNQDFNQKVASGGHAFTLRHWNQIPDTDSNVGTDAAAAATPEKLTMGYQQTKVMTRNKGYEFANLVDTLAGENGIDRLIVGDGAGTEGLAQMWANDFDKTLSSQITGIKADNLANNAGDMIFRTPEANAASAVVAGAVDAADLVSASTIASTKLTMGDRGGELGVMVCHPVIKANLEVRGLLQTAYATEQFPGQATFNGTIVGAEGVPYTGQALEISTALGFRVVASENVPLAATAGGATIYTTLLFAPGFFQYGEAPHSNPLERDRIAEAGNGEGFDRVWTRRKFLLHPQGFSMSDAVGVQSGGAAPQATVSNATLALASTWTRVWPRKLCRMAFMDSLG